MEPLLMGGGMVQDMDWQQLYMDCAAPDSAYVAEVSQPALPLGITGLVDERDWEYYGTNEPIADNQQLGALDASSMNGPALEKTQFRRPTRKQNRACDQCRASKKACDLQSLPPPSRGKGHSACSKCRAKNMECTVSWLQTKQNLRRASTSARPQVQSQALQETSEPSPPRSVHQEDWYNLETASSPSGTALRLFLARETCAQKFQLYIEAADMPLSQCLWYGSMPPRFRLGVTAYSQITNNSDTALSCCVEKAKMWLDTCWVTKPDAWGMLAFAPHLLRTVSVLDALFEERRGGRAWAARDSSITETYKWVAVAIGSQFTAHAASSSSRVESNVWHDSSYDRDIAMNTWNRAKSMLFGNVSATTSFRLAMALVLFGLITPPKKENKDAMHDVDADFAFCEGIKRLHRLCADAYTQLDMIKDAPTEWPGDTPNPPRELPADMKDNITELVGAVEWFINMSNAYKTSTTRGAVCAIHPDAISMTSLEIRAAAQAAANHGSPDSVARSEDIVRSQHDIEESILVRAKADEQSFTSLWSHRVSDDRLFQVARNIFSVSIILSQCLARFTMAVDAFENRAFNTAAIHQQYKAMMELLKLWRARFGTLASIPMEHLREAQTEHWRIVAMCSTDTELVILLFCDGVRKLEQRLRVASQQNGGTDETKRLTFTLRATEEYRSSQRAVSATEIVTIGSLYLSDEGASSQGGGVRARRLGLIGTRPVGTF